jgi:hypothetical protein
MGCRFRIKLILRILHPKVTEHGTEAFLVFVSVTDAVGSLDITGVDSDFIVFVSSDCVPKIVLTRVPNLSMRSSSDIFGSLLRLII